MDFDRTFRTRQQNASPQHGSGHVALGHTSERSNHGASFGEAVTEPGIVVEAPAAERDEVLDGKFRVDELLGQGGMGQVYRGLHLALQVPIAIKFLRVELAERADALARFLQEARLAAGLRSEHAARIYDVSTTSDGQPYIVMEFLDGQDLERKLAAEGTFSARLAVDLMLQVLEVLHEAHAQGLVHRDIKPANMVLTGTEARPSVKLLDFGVSFSVHATSERITGANTLLGSPAYMSPEQLRDSASVDALSDIWSCGVTLFEMLTGTMPFNSDSIPALCAAVLNESPGSLRTLRPDVPPGLAVVVMQCLEKNPARRPNSAQSLARLIAPYASPSGQAKLNAWSSDSDRPAATSRTRPVLRLVLGGVGVMALLGSALTLWTRNAPTVSGAKPTSESTTLPTESASKVAPLPNAEDMTLVPLTKDSPPALGTAAPNATPSAKRVDRVAPIAPVRIKKSGEMDIIQ
jgi:eukaryotic-like serine/threonine-protein kinase